MRTRIKFCGLVEAVDVDTAVALGVDAIGLVFFARSPRALSIEQALVLRRRIPSYIRCVGLFVNEHAAQVQAFRDQVGLDLIQFHGDETVEYIARRPQAKPLTGVRCECAAGLIC